MIQRIVRKALWGLFFFAFFEKFFVPVLTSGGHPALSTAYMNDCEPLLCFAQQVYGYGKVLNVPLDEFEEFKRHAASTGWGKNQKNKSQNPQKVGRCTSNAGIVVLDKTAGETISIVPKNAAHAILRC